MKSSKFERAKEQIKDHTDIITIISSYIKLKKQGKDYVGLCPFHNEKTPSFHVSPDSQLFYCYGCNAGGDVIKFIELKESMSFLDALHFLADRLGISIDFGDDAVEQKAATARKRLLDIMSFASNFYCFSLLKSNTTEAKNTLEYLRKRNLNAETILAFKLGYSPDSWADLINLLKNKGFNEQELVDSGLAIRSDKGNIYNRFRGRLMFPILDRQGRTIAFGARQMDEKGPKYLNSPETSVFQKSKTLYGLNLAHDEIKQKGEAVLVEGYMDVIKCWQFGIKNTVATLGTAFGINHARILKVYTEKAIMSYDSDLAGQEATIRGISFLQQGGLDVKIAVFPEGKDPDEFLDNYGADAFYEKIMHAQQINDYRLSRILHNFDLNEISQKKRAATDAAKFVASIDNTVEIDHYLHKISEMLNIKESNFRNIYMQFVNKQQPSAMADKIPGKISMENNSWVKAENIFLASVLTAEQNARQSIAQTFDCNSLCTEEGKAIFKQIIEHSFDDYNDFVKQNYENSEEKLKNKLLSVLSEGKKLFNGEISIREASNRLLNAGYDAGISDLKKQIIHAEKSSDDTSIYAMLDEMQKLYALKNEIE